MDDLVLDLLGPGGDIFSIFLPLLSLAVTI